MSKIIKFPEHRSKRAKWRTMYEKERRNLQRQRINEILIFLLYTLGVVVLTGLTVSTILTTP